MKKGRIRGEGDEEEEEDYDILYISSNHAKTLLLTITIRNLLILKSA
jgi:hypothetical protein